MIYLPNREEFYRTLLIQFASETAEKKNNLEKYLSSDDIKNYEIIIHSLKSSSKMIGDMSLSEKARQLEIAAKEGRRGYIRANHYQAMEEYLRLTEAISSSLGKNNDEVLEFLPDSDIIEFEPEGEKRRSLQDSFHGQIMLLRPVLEVRNGKYPTVKKEDLYNEIHTYFRPSHRQTCRRFLNA